jgi:hypothetical protein
MLARRQVWPTRLGDAARRQVIAMYFEYDGNLACWWWPGSSPKRPALDAAGGEIWTGTGSIGFRRQWPIQRRFVTVTPTRWPVRSRSPITAVADVHSGHYGSAGLNPGSLLRRGTSGAVAYGVPRRRSVRQGGASPASARLVIAREVRPAAS